MKRIRLTVSDSTAELIAEWAKEKKQTRGEIVADAMGVYTSVESDRVDEEEQAEPD
jgi:NAD dependent epimerase/dehydratase family enzyme